MISEIIFQDNKRDLMCLSDIIEGQIQCQDRQLRL